MKAQKSSVGSCLPMIFFILVVGVGLVYYFDYDIGKLFRGWARGAWRWFRG